MYIILIFAVIGAIISFALDYMKCKKYKKQYVMEDRILDIIKGLFYGAFIGFFITLILIEVFAVNVSHFNIFIK
jgi:uncharacterized integral membrane protein